MISLKGIDLRHLIYFAAVAEHGNFSRAAAQLHMAQPPLSQQIMDLEARIGAPLFARDKRNVALTEAGRVLLPEARAIIAQAKSAVQKVRRLGLGLTGTLRIGMMSTGPYNPNILKLLQAFSKQFPQVQVDLRLMSSLDQREAMQRDAIDLSFHWPWDERQDQKFATHHYAPHRFVLAVPEHFAHERGKPIYPCKLGHLPWFVAGQGHNRPWHTATLSLFRAARFKPAQVIEQNPAPFALALVAAGQGVTLIPDFMTASTPGVHCAQLKKIPGWSPQISLCLSKKRVHKQGLIADFFAAATGA